MQEWASIPLAYEVDGLWREPYLQLASNGSAIPNPPPQVEKGLAQANFKFVQAALKKMHSATRANRFWLRVKPCGHAAISSVGATGTLVYQTGVDKEPPVESFYENSAVHRVDGHFLRTLAQVINDTIPANLVVETSAMSNL